MIQLSAFADEISADLHEQVEVLQSEGIHFVDFRSAWGKNVLDLTDEQVADVKSILGAAGIGVAAIGSPIGKVRIDSSMSDHMRRFERAIEVAKAWNTHYIRIFSYYLPEGASESQWPEYREAIISNLREMTQKAAEVGITLVHENEKDIYGDTIERNIDILQSISHANMKAALDPANYLQCAQQPYPAAYEAMKPWLGYVHVKDVDANGTLVVAGDGEAKWLELLTRLKNDGYSGFMALEPHLAAAGQYQGFSGPDLFKKAAQALKRLLAEVGWSHS